MLLFRKIFNSFFKKPVETGEGEQKNINQSNSRCVALGVLLQAVAESDDSFIPEERDIIVGILKQYYNFNQEQLNLVLETIEKSFRERIDLYSFTSKFSRSLEYPQRVKLVKLLFKIAYADGVLAPRERETIRKIAKLLYVDHGDFINAKLEAKEDAKI
jgi:uncharacterized tellurite resistance protein B-like protein